jgi:hypothetical protein
MIRRAGVVRGARRVASDLELSSGVDHASSVQPGAKSKLYYPHQSDLVFAALPSAVPCVRSHARQVVWEWGLAALAEKVELVVSELVTNAVAASEGLADSQHGLPTIQLWLSADHERVGIKVWDANEELPQEASARPRG